MKAASKQERGVRRLNLLGAVVLVAAGACGADTTETADAETGALSTEPPWGLESTELPDDADTVAAVFASMPSEVDGMAAEVWESGVIYTGTADRYAQVTAMPLVDMEDFAGAGSMTPQLWLSTMAESGEMESVESTQLDPNQPLVWLAGTGTGNGVLYYSGTWGAPDGQWLFTVTADTAEIRTDLVHSFIEATQNTG